MKKFLLEPRYNNLIYIGGILVGFGLGLPNSPSKIIFWLLGMALIIIGSTKKLK